MSLFSSLQIGRSGLTAAQTGLSVTGNNISNAGTVGYTRETVVQSPTDPDQLTPNIALGTGVQVTSVQRQVNETLNSSLRSATSDQSSADTLNTQLTSLQSTIGTLGDNDLSQQAQSFFDSFNTLAQNPTNTAQQALVVQNGASLASYVQNLRSQIGSLSTNASASITADVKTANSYLTQIASLNQQISSQAGGATLNTLEDQRDTALSSLSGLMNITTVPQANGSVNVLANGRPLVEGNTATPITTKTTSDSSGTTTQVVFANGDAVSVTSGEIAGLSEAQSKYLEPAIQSIDQFASGLIQTVNTIHASGQGTDQFSTVTGATQVLDTTAPLNAATTTTGLPAVPTNGTFTIYETDATTGQTTARQIDVSLDGSSPDSLTSLAGKISDSNITASVNSTGQLVIKANSSNTKFSFGDDTSGTLAAVGINTFFTGSDAGDIAVNQTVVDDPALVATGQGNTTGSNANALALAQGFTTSSSNLGNQSLQDFYTGFVGNLAAAAKSVSENATTQDAVQSSVSAQQQAISGVDMNEEAVNLTLYQRAFESSAKYISTVNDLMDELMNMAR